MFSEFTTTQTSSNCVRLFLSLKCTHKGPQCDPEAAKKFFLQLYKNLHVEREKPLYSHFTCATDTKNITFVFESVKDTLFIEHLKYFNLE